uniref:CW-type domain-containing protein n=1 Tax=Cajanus cajan TaxID=3821 RepID=A0A151S5U7_CAJCA|nr:hypothetical protein KK1_028121 [Cajanus cajan]
MKENTELEEGEACYYQDDDEASIDPDSFCYIDEKIQHVLGHFQKDFEGGVSAENLGAKFGGYGSFLPTHERSPCFWSQPRSPQRNHSSPNYIIIQVVSHDTKAPSSVPSSARPENASHSSHSLRDIRAASVNDSMKKEQGISSVDTAERCTLKDDTTKKTGKSTDQRTLKFRFKMKSSILAQKNAEIYSGLGLDNSPSSSMGSSPVESEGMPPVSQENAEDSPTQIIQVMTSFPIPGGVLISPLHESFLNLTKNEKVTGDSRDLSSLNGHQDPCSMSADESNSFVGDGHLKKQTVRIVRQSEKQLELTHVNGIISEKDMTLHKKKKLGNRTPDCKDFLSNELKWTPLSSSICDAGEIAEVTAKSSKASKEINENGARSRMVTIEALKEESLESISDSFGGANKAMIFDKGSAGSDNSCRSKMNKSNNRDSLKEKKSERKVDSLAGNGAVKYSSINNGKQSAFGAKAKERPSGHKVVDQLAAVPCIKDTSASLPNLAPEMISSAVAPPQVILEDWVCCDSCQQWRLLPYGMKPDHLPDKWLCSMLNWLPKMNSCNVSEDETTKALYAMYQMPISEGQNNMQSHGINNDGLQFPNSAKINSQISGKNRSLNGMNQHAAADLNPMKKMSSSKHLSRLENMIEEKHVPKDKEKQVNGGDRKHFKLKRKMDPDQYKSGTPKKSRTENVCHADKQLNPGMGLEKVALYSKNGFPKKASGKDMRKYDESCLSEDVQVRLPVTAKKEGDQAQVSSGGGSLDVKSSIRSDRLMKKRKLKDRPNDEKQYGEEGNVSEFRKEKKHRILNKEAKSVTEEVRFADKCNQPRKHRKSITSLHASDGIDLGSGPLSLAATSSSSKISGSHKAKTNFEDVIGSPVESVTSSPLRASNLDKNILAVGDTSVKGSVHVEQPGYIANGICHDEKVNKDNQESELSWQKSGKVTSLHSKENGRESGSHVGKAVDPSNHASGAKTKSDAKYTSPKSKSEIDGISQKSALRHGLHETRKPTELNQRDFENSVPKMDAQCISDRKTISHQNLTWDFEEENNANHVSIETSIGKSKVLSSAVSEVKRETLNVGSRTGPRYQKGGMSNEHPVHVSGNFVLDQQVTVSSPLRTNSNQTAVDTLEEATKLKDRADNYKNSGFDFESNETYFEAGLKFLHGASLLENCHNESSKHGEMSQMQILATAAKLFKCCASEYETRQEMAAAALAYKCMEVAYMRLVYCKNSSTNRDRHELQSALQMVSQGESPSSSASDVDNLNNQAAADKATLLRGTNTHVAINQVIPARTCPTLVRLLDFTQDINFAMEASRKCQSTFAAANLAMEEARNKDWITSIRSVIDFGFQDVDELVRLVWTATKAISRAGLGGARD